MSSWHAGSSIQFSNENNDNSSITSIDSKEKTNVIMKLLRYLGLSYCLEIV